MAGLQTCGCENTENEYNWKFS